MGEYKCFFCGQHDDEYHYKKCPHTNKPFALPTKQPTVESLEKLKDWHIDHHHCDDEGSGCEIVSDEVKGYKRHYCKLEEDSYKALARLIQTSNRDVVLKQGVHHAAEMSILDQEIMSLKAEIKRLQTLTKDKDEKENTL